jgi:hypothetical protein
MKFRKLFNFLFIFVVFGNPNFSKIVKNEGISSSAKAFHEVIHKLFVENAMRFEIAVIKENSRSFYDFYNGLLAQIKELNSYKLSTFELDKMEKIGIFTSTVFLIESCNTFVALHHRAVLLNSFSEKLKFLTYIYNCSVNILQDYIDQMIPTKIMSYWPGTLEMFEFQLINDGDHLHLTTVEWFTEAACNFPQLNVLNSFNKFTKKWEKNWGNYQKFKDFYRCELGIGIRTDQQSSCFGFVDPNKTEATGLIPDLFRISSHLHNFERKEIGLGDRAVNVTVFFLPLRLTSLTDENWMHATSTFMEIRDIIITTPGELYTSYEKLWLPFDNMTWTLLLSTFLIAFASIIIIKKLPEIIQKRVFGEKIQNPALNVITTFFGITQNKLPMHSIPRFILINFVLFCLIFRTCYQSKLFDFMTGEPRHPPPNTILDLKNGCFTIYSDIDVDYLRSLIENEKDLW